MTYEKEAIEALEKYLTWTVDSRRWLAEKNNMRKPKGYKYECFEHYVVENGKAYHEVSELTHYQRGMMKQCFDNSYKLAMRSRGRLTYVEGFADSGIIPVLHAWCEDEHGRVVDITWEEGHGKAYYGVQFDRYEVKAMRDRTGFCSMIDNWEEQFPLLRA